MANIITNSWKFITAPFRSSASKQMTAAEAKNQQMDTTMGKKWTSGISVLAHGPEFELMKLLENSKAGYQIKDPYFWRSLSRIVFNSVPLVERAFNLHAQKVGSVDIDPDSVSPASYERIKKEILPKIKVLTESQPNHSNNKGLDSLVHQAIVNTLIEGNTFLQDRFKEVNGVVTNEMLGVMLFESEHFCYTYVNNEMTLAYLQNQYPQLNDELQPEESPFFHIVGFEYDAGYNWGVPLLRGSDLMTNVFVSLLVAVKLQALRFGNPLSVTTVQQKDSKFLEKNTDMAKAFTAAIKDLRTKVSEGLAKMLQGIPVEVVTSIPGDVEVNTALFGENFSSFVDHDLLWKIAVLFCITLSVPPEMLGITLAGGGLGDDRFKEMRNVFGARIDRIRNQIDPTVVQIIRNRMISDGGYPMQDIINVATRYISPDDMTEKEKADLDNVEADTESKRVENYIKMRVVDQQRAERYAEQHNLGTVQ